MFNIVRLILGLTSGMEPTPMSPNLKSLVFSLVILCFAVAAQFAAAADPHAWTARGVSGTADVQVPGMAWKTLSQGQQVLVGATIRTGKDGHVVLSRDDESVTIAAASSFEIKPAGDGMLTRIFQSAGTLMFKVHKRPDRHFEVGTPYLVAVVKGTTFTVSVDGNGSAVHVTEGLVEVAGLSGPDKLLLHPGQTGSVGSKSGSKVQSGSVAPEKGGATTKKGAQAPAIKQAIQTASVDLEKASNGLFKNPNKQNAKDKDQDKEAQGNSVSGLLDTVGGALGEGGNGNGNGNGGSGGNGGGSGNGLGGAAAGAANGVGGAVSSVAGGVGGSLGGGLGNTVSGVGSGLGSTVSGVGGAVGGTVSGLGGALGGLLGGGKK
jgi:ferric-dicitrate binding protein FerR (iron transport regulator)